MKRTIITIFFTVVVVAAFAQKQKVNYITTFDDKLIHFGFSLGLNTLDFAVVNYNPISSNPDFHPQNWQLDQPQISYLSVVQADVARLVPGFTVGIISSVRLGRDFNLRILPGL